MSQNILDTLKMVFGHVENFVWEFENEFRTQKQEFESSINNDADVPAEVDPSEI